MASPPFAIPTVAFCFAIISPGITPGSRWYQVAITTRRFRPETGRPRADLGYLAGGAGLSNNDVNGMPTQTP